MKRFSRMFTLLVLLAVLAVPTAATFAQEGPQNPLCQGLSAEDCDLMTAPATAMAELTSLTMPNWSIDFSMTIPEETSMEPGAPTPDPSVPPPTQTVTLTANGSTGGLSMDPAADIRLHLVVDELTMTEGEETQSISAEVVVTQDMAYILYNDQWYGGTLEEAGINPEDLDELGSLTTGEMDLAAIGIDLTGAIITARGENIEINGQEVATFNTEVDVTQLLIAALSSPAAGELLGEGMGGQPMTQEDVQMLGMFLQPMLAGTTLSSEQWIGLENNYLRHLAVDMTLVIDLSMLLPEVGRIDGKLNFMTDMANFNEPLSATVPSDYAPIEQLEEDAELDLGGVGDMGSGLGM